MPRLRLGAIWSLPFLVVTVMPAFGVTVSKDPLGDLAEQDISPVDESRPVFETATPMGEVDRAYFDDQWMQADKPDPLSPAIGTIPSEGSSLGGALILPEAFD
ncbi:MAG: hypothetical protein AAGH83_04015 [Pseudomonadota bacterium]